MSQYRVLTDEHVASFLDKGYLIVKDCLDLSLAQRWIAGAYERLGYDPADATTWVKDLVRMDHKHQLPVREAAPKAWAALLDVVGGEERLENQVMGKPLGHFSSINSFAWSDAFIVNFHYGAGEAWRLPSGQVTGWHKDGSYFRHFLDSREQALLTVVLWSDMRHQGGGTFIAPDSVRVVARYLAEHPEGVKPSEFDYPTLIGQCRQFEELTGHAGDFVILHPFMLHASSQNVLGQPRFMTNPPIVLKDPMNFNRERSQDFSLLESATLHYLGLERLDFKPTAPREANWWPVEAAPA
jgi:hypothetical protein